VANIDHDVHEIFEIVPTVFENVKERQQRRYKRKQRWTPLELEDAEQLKPLRAIQEEDSKLEKSNASLRLPKTS
jgi:hypothetical protein